MKLEYKITEKDLGKTINQILLSELKISNRLLFKLIHLNKIYLNEKLIDTRKNANINDVISVDLSYEEISNIKPTKMNLDIIYEDEWFVVINKPALISIHPSILHYEDSLSNGVQFYFNQINLKKQIRPVNRLDLNTSGLTIFAKCEYIQQCFTNQMKENTFIKEYLCLVNGSLNPKKGTIDLPISRKPGSIIERYINKNRSKIYYTL